MLKSMAIMVLSSLLLHVAPDMASAQDMSKYYTVMHPEKFSIDWTGFYKANNAATARVRQQYPHHLDISFGSHSKQALDLYLPPGKVSNAPVFLFLHGGGFREGDRAHYGFIALPFIKNGIITAVASYRLMGEGFHFPAQSNDVKHAVKWLYENVSSYGGNANAIFVGGHSAGAILSADIGVDRDWMPRMGIPTEALRGIIPVSGPYDLRNKGKTTYESAYAPTAELKVLASPILHINDPMPAAIVACGSKEKYEESSSEFSRALWAAGVKGDYLNLEGQGHADTALSLGNENSHLFKRVLALIREHQ